MHCDFDNLITIAKCFCKAIRILQSNTQVWGAGPPSCVFFWFFFLRGVLCSPLPPPKHNTDYLVLYQKWNDGEYLQQLHFVLKAKARLPFATASALTIQPALAICGWRGNRREEEGRKKKSQQKPHYCRPDGNIPHDQTNQSPRWGAGAAQPWSNTPFHSLSGTNTWSPINGTPRTWGGSLEPYWSMPDDFIITHHFIHWRIRTSILITFPGTCHVAHINRALGELRLPSCCSPSRAGEEEATWSWELLLQTKINGNIAPLAEINCV